MTAPRYEPRVLVRRIEPRPDTPLKLLAHGLASMVLVPGYMMAAKALGAPGLRFHGEAANVAVRLAIHGGRGRLREAGRLALYPMDSTRYFEFDWAWRRMTRLGRVACYLDVSSPRLLPLCFARRPQVERVWLINPDRADLEGTARWTDALALGEKCRCAAATVEESGFGPGTFDLVTSISVFEHVPDETRALAHLRTLLAPGGRLLLTLPCAARGYDQYRDYDEYKLRPPDADGRYFFQRFYDRESLRTRVLSVLGEPRTTTVYGEREPGYFGRNAEQKMRGLPYPFWREGYMMGRHFQLYPSIDALPGEGVVALEFQA